MAFPRRLWLAGVTLAVAAVAASTARAVDIKFLPSNTELVVSLNLKQMLESEIAKQYKELLDQARGALQGQIENNPAAKYLEKAGFDLLKDLHSVTVASNGSKEVDAVFLVIEGKFNVEKIHATAEEIAREAGEVIKISKIGTTKVYELTPQGEKRIYAALINSTTMVAGPSEAALKAAITGTANRGMKDTVKSLLKTTSNKQSFSFVATGAALGKLTENAPIPNGEVVAGMLQNLEGVSVAVTLGKDIQFQLGVNAKDEATAKQMMQSSNLGLAMVKQLAAQKAKENEELQPLVDIAKTLRITADGPNVVLRAEISVENLEKLIKVLPKNFNR